MNYKLTGVVMAVVMVLTGCASPKQEGGIQPADVSSQQVSLDRACNPLIVAMGAAAVCGIVASGNNRVQAAAACAAVALAACYLTNSYHAKQTRNARQVADEHLRQNRALPSNPTVSSFIGNVDPRTAVSIGQEVRVSSVIVVVPGRDNVNVKVEEKLQIVDARGEAWGPTVRRLANPLGEAGEFNTSFIIPIRPGWSQGIYTVQRTVYLNGVASGSTDSSVRFKIV